MFIEEIFMKIEKINKDNIKEYIRDMGIDITYVDEKQLINLSLIHISEPTRPY